MSLSFHWDNLTGYLNFIINSKRTVKLCLLQNYKLISDILNNYLIPYETENKLKTCMSHTEFIVVHLWSIDIENAILKINKQTDESIGDYRDRVRPHIINLIKLNYVLMENIKIYNNNMEPIKKEKIREELDELLLLNF